MKYRNTIIALIIVVLLGSYIYFFERKPIKKTEPGKPSTLFIPQFDFDKVSKLEIVHQDTTKHIIIERTNKKSWELKSPVSAKANKFAVDNLVNEFKDLIPSRILEEKELHFATYGLATPALILTITYSDPKLAPTKIQVGNKTPNAEDYYVKKENETKVYLIPVKTVAMWNKEADAFRDKMVLEFETDRITQIELKYPKAHFICAKEKDQWWVTQPEKVQVDRNKIDDLLWKLHGLEVKQFVDESAAVGKDLKSYGLDKSQIELNLKSSDGKLVTLSLGKINPAEGTMYAKTADKSYIFSLETTAIKEIAISSVADLRDRSVLTFETDTITSIELKYPDKTIICAKEKSDWWVVQPKRFKADEIKIDDLLWRLNGLSIKEFGESQPKNLAKCGLDKPAIIVALQSNTAQIPTLSIGKVDEKKHLIYAQSSNKDFIFQLDDSLMQDLKVTETDLEEKKIEKQ